MKNNTSIRYLIFAIAAFAFGCSRPAKGQNKNNAPESSAATGQKYNIDTQKSVVTWKGSNSFGSHSGYISISKGALLVEGGQLMGGTAEVDMNTITDETNKGDSGLVKHLKDPDFFDVKKFPISKIELFKAAGPNNKYITVKANLTIKDITHPVTFPARIEAKDGVVKLIGNLVIDRTLWDVRYNSGKLFDNLKDQAISDSIEFKFAIIAKE